jgi:Zn-dependent protease
MVVLVLAIGLHEYGHAKFADLAGDDTPRLMGRVTLNPIKHLDPVGTIMMVVSSLTGFGIGWGKPVMVRPDRMKNPRWDHFISVLAGPAMNFIQAVAYAAALRILISMGQANFTGGIDLGSLGFIPLFLTLGVFINVALMLFNLIPLGPLDGHWLVGAFLPEKARLEWYRFNHGIGSLIFLVLVFIPSGPYDLLGNYLFPVVNRVFAFLLGIPHG